MPKGGLDAGHLMQGTRAKVTNGHQGPYKICVYSRQHYLIIQTVQEILWHGLVLGLPVKRRLLLPDQWSKSCPGRLVLSFRATFLGPRRNVWRSGEVWCLSEYPPSGKNRYSPD